MDLERAKLDGLLAGLRELERTRRNLRKQLDAAGAAAQEGTAAGTTYEADQFAGLEAFRQFVKRRELEIAMEESECRRSIERQRHEVTVARRNRQVLERLREKALDEWNQAYAKELEETASDLHLAKLWNSRQHPPIRK